MLRLAGNLTLWFGFLGPFGFRHLTQDYQHWEAGS